MTRNANKPFSPDYARPPRRMLEQSMAVSWMSQTELVLRTGLSRKTISGIIHGKALITTDTAILLEKVFRVPANFWKNLEKKYDEAQVRWNIRTFHRR